MDERKTSEEHIRHSPHPDTMLKAEHLKKQFGNTIALADVSLSLDTGICAITGPNGAGKTTLLRVLTGAERADSGAVFLDGMPLSGDDIRILRHISYLSDKVPLYSDLTVEDHLQYRGRLKGLPPRRLRARMRHLTETLDLRQIFTKRTATLSAGQRKRVGIADAMLTDASVLAIDEPFAGVDDVHCGMILAALRSAARHSLVLLATHRFDILEKADGTCIVLATGKVAATFGLGAAVQQTDGADSAATAAPQPDLALRDRITLAVKGFYERGLEAKP